MSEEPASKSWWSTLPGILTGTAAVIGAVATLLTVWPPNPPDGPPPPCSEWQRQLDEKLRIRDMGKRRLEDAGRVPFKDAEEGLGLERDVRNLEEEIRRLDAEIRAKCKLPK